MYRFARSATGDDINWLVNLFVEVVNPELIEIAEDHVARSVRDGVYPVLKRLFVMRVEVLSALLHFDKDPGLPHEIREAAASGGVFLDPVFEFCPGLLAALVTKTQEEPVAEYLSFSFLVALQKGDVLLELLKTVRYQTHFAPWRSPIPRFKRSQPQHTKSRTKLR
ncbi:MAG: hypothetical protein E5W70_31625 [Mesorhizobium sp.]|nr:hypothetical protein [Mesorhizobium sp.]TIT17691.1 MAG: hypothetical protein E5W70_31625 [Mesorhizobium sp.]